MVAGKKTTTTSTTAFVFHVHRIQANLNYYLCALFFSATLVFYVHRIQINRNFSLCALFCYQVSRKRCGSDPAPAYPERHIPIGEPKRGDTGHHRTPDVPRGRSRLGGAVHQAHAPAAQAKGQNVNTFLCFKCSVSFSSSLFFLFIFRHVYLFIYLFFSSLLLLLWLLRLLLWLCACCGCRGCCGCYGCCGWRLG